MSMGVNPFIIAYLGFLGKPGARHAMMADDRFFPPLPMNIQHFEKGLHYNDKELLMLARKIGKLATYCRRVKDEASFIRVEAERRDTKKDKDSVKVMITVQLPKKSLRAETRQFNVIDAVDRAIEKIEPQIKRYKEMMLDRGHGPRRREQAKGKRRIRTGSDDLRMAA
jgi:ribosomal subunit interface protein